MDMATEEIRKQILDYVRRYGKEPSENDIDFSEKSSYSVHTLFKSLIFDGYIVETILIHGNMLLSKKLMEPCDFLVFALIV